MRYVRRRDLLTGLACSSFSLSSGAALGGRIIPDPSAGSRDSSFLEITRQPDSVTVFLGLNQPLYLTRAAARWEYGNIRVRTEVGRHELPIYVAAVGKHPTHIHVRWNTGVAASLLVLGDHWERSYGDLHWSSLVPERVMPWYFMTRHDEALHGYGVKTGSGALCFWQLDPDGVSLWLNVCNGGSGVELGERELLAAVVVSRRGEPGEDPVCAAKALCTKMCEAPRSGPSVIYGSNDWYYAYGKNSAEQIVRDAELVSSLAPSKGERPFTVIDDGWKNKEAYPDMTALAQAIRRQGVRPGLWIRPLEAPNEAAPALLLPKERFGPRANRRSDLAYDPTIPEALDSVLAKVKEATAWGYELVKHDYTTFDLLGRWGFEMKAQPTLPDWNFHDRSRTTAEIVRDLYASIRRVAGDRTILVGCNTIGHLAAGFFEAQRTGDDTSGTNWERTRRMGVNTLAYRLPQHRTFFLLDADCVPITKATPWSCNKQWLDLVARTGTILFVSPEPAAIGEEQRQALREAFHTALSAGDDARPMDWETTTTPGRWKFRDHQAPGHIQKKYDWYEQAGAWPYDV
jgi:alpha-galactosidase